MPVEENVREKFIEGLKAVGRSLSRLIELAEEGKIEKVDVEDLYCIECGKRGDIPPGYVREVSMTKATNIVSFTVSDLSGKQTPS